MTHPTVVITGGTKGLGAVIAQQFHAAGYRVAIIARSDSGAGQLPGDRSKFFACDMTSVKEIEQTFRKIAEWSPAIDVLINNVGRSGWMPLADITEEFWDQMIDTNLKSAFFACKNAAASMNEGASIINISSLAGKRGSANNSVYCASKFGMNGLTQSLAKELGPRQIRVNAVCPVYLRTPGLDDALGDPNAPAKGGDISQYLDEFARTQTALGVLPTEQQVADTCLFLASQAASAITGQCINVDCGVLPQ